MRLNFYRIKSKVTFLFLIKTQKKSYLYTYILHWTTMNNVYTVLIVLSQHKATASVSIYVTQRYLMAMDIPTT